MSEKMSRAILIGELFVIVLPLSVLLLFATIVQVPNSIEFLTWYNIANSFFGLAACAAVTAGILISRVFIRQGSAGLRNLRPTLWILSLVGAILALAAMVSKLLPPSPEYSPEAMFRADFELFVLGLPMFIPLSHLILERFRGKKEKLSTDSKPLSAV
jgi:hypothetical protein